GLAGASATHQDVFSVFGSARSTTLLRLQIPVSLPTVFDGLALAAPTAILGATIGEWFGAPRGLGVLIVSAMQNYQVLLLWAAALTAALLSLAAYLVAVRLQSGAVRRFT
ncbi:MAG: ABC transporter permease subunit, partial [Microbacteriaceae bacterium]